MNLNIKLHFCDLEKLSEKVDNWVATTESLVATTATKQDKTDTNLKTTAKTIVGAINEVRSQAMSSHLTIHGGEVVQNYSQGDEPQFTTIVKDLPAGRYTISCNLISATGTYPNSQNYGYSSIVMYNSDSNVIGKADVFPQGVDIVVSEVATLKICPVRATAFNIQNGELVPNANLAIEISEKYTFKNIWVLPAHECNLGELEQSVESLGETKQDKTDTNLNTTAKTIVGAINEVRSQAMSSHLTIHGGEVVQNYSQGDEPQFTTIVKDLPAGRYTISCNLISATGTYPNSQNYGYSSIVMYNSDSNVIGKADVFPQGVDIVVSEVATLKICPVRATAFNIQNGELVPNANLAIEISEKYTFKNIWVLPSHECDLGTVGSRLDALEKLPAKTADVSLFATTEKGRSYDDVYVKAPTGMLKETDQVIFARYITNKTRPRVNGQTDKSTPRRVYRGWIKPAKGGKHNSPLLLPDDKLKLIYQTTIDGYDHFYLDVDPDGDDEPLLFYLWEYARIDKDGHRHPRVKDKKLGIKIVRDGNTVVDYLPFTVEVDLNDHIHFGRL